MESQPKKPEFRNNPRNFHPCIQASTWDFDTNPNPQQPRLIPACTYVQSGHSLHCSHTQNRDGDEDSSQPLDR